MTCWSGICGSLFCVPNTTCIIFHFTYGNTCALLLYVTAFLFSSSCFIFFFFILFLFYTLLKVPSGMKFFLPFFAIFSQPTVIVSKKSITSHSPLPAKRYAPEVILCARQGGNALCCSRSNRVYCPSVYHILPPNYFSLLSYSFNITSIITY